MKGLAALLIALGLVGAAPSFAVEQEVWVARYPLVPGGQVIVENVQGDIVVEGWARAEVEVAAVKTTSGPESRLEDVRIAVDAREGALTVKTVYVGQAGPPVRVDYRLRVPRQVRLVPLSTVDGDIAVRGIEGAVKGRSLHGDVGLVDVAGGVEVSTVTGSIWAALRALPETGPALAFETINGDIELHLPARVNANLEARTVAGKIASDYALMVSSVPGDTARRARLGRGGTLVKLRTVRGNIRVAEAEDLL